MLQNAFKQTDVLKRTVCLFYIIYTDFLDKLEDKILERIRCYLVGGDYLATIGATSFPTSLEGRVEDGG